MCFLTPHTSCFSCRIYFVRFTLMFSDRENTKKRKVDSECRQFNDEWKIKYFFVKANNKGSLCLICRDSVAVLKEYNICRHYERKRGSSFSHMT